MQENSNEIGIAFLYAWNEYLEGGYLAPTLGDPDGKMLQAAGAAIADINGLAFDGYRSWEEDYSEPELPEITVKEAYVYEKNNVSDNRETDDSSVKESDKQADTTKKPNTATPSEKKDGWIPFVVIAVVAVVAVSVFVVIKIKRRS